MSQKTCRVPWSELYDYSKNFEWFTSSKKLIDFLFVDIHIKECSILSPVKNLRRNVIHTTWTNRTLVKTRFSSNTITAHRQRYSCSKFQHQQVNPTGKSHPFHSNQMKRDRRGGNLLPTWFLPFCTTNDNDTSSNNSTLAGHPLTFSELVPQPDASFFIQIMSVYACSSLVNFLPFFCTPGCSSCKVQNLPPVVCSFSLPALALFVCPPGSVPNKYHKWMQIKKAK